MRRFRFAVTSLTAAAALGIAGCGGGGDSGEAKQRYARDLQHTGQDLSRTLRRIEQQTGASSSLAETGARLRRGAAAIDATATRFAAIRPPAEAQAAHRKLVDALHEMAGVLRRAADAARANHRAKMASILQGLVDGAPARKLGEAEKELRDRGITAAATAATTAGG